MGGLQYFLNASLFMFRIQGVFLHQPVVLRFFYFMLLAVLASCVAAAFSLDALQLGPTNYCLYTKLRDYGAVCIVVSAVYDTLVFSSITARLLLNNRGPWTSSRRMFFTGRGMGSLSRLLLQSGQLYFMCACRYISVNSRFLTISFGCHWQGVSWLYNRVSCHSCVSLSSRSVQRRIYQGKCACHEYDGDASVSLPQAWAFEGPESASFISVQ